MKEQEQKEWRQRAIDNIGRQCRVTSKVAIVTGHFMFRYKELETPQPVYTLNDMATCTHILYLHELVDTISSRHFLDTADAGKIRPTNTPVNHFNKRQETGETQLRNLCRHHGILFQILHSKETFLGKVSVLLSDFRPHSEAYNLSCAEKRLDQIVTSHSSHQVERMLVIDGDKTFAAADTGKDYW